MENDIVSLAELIVRGICADQNRIEVEKKDLSRSSNILVRVADEDMGKILGSGRSTFNALRGVLALAGKRAGKIVRVELLDPFFSETRSSNAYSPAAEWDRKSFEHILTRTIGFVFGDMTEISRKAVTKTITVYEIRIASGEEIGNLDDAQKAFETLFSAVGKSFRHTVHVDLVPPSTSEA